MRTFTSTQELCDYSKSNLQLKLRRKSKPSKKLLKRIVQEEKKNCNRQLAIAKLLHLLSLELSFERELEIYNVLAFRMSECCLEQDLDLIDFIIMKGQIQFLGGIHTPVVLAMCYLLRFKFGLMSDVEKENLKSWHRLLRDYHISYHFEAQIFHFHNLKVKSFSKKDAA